MQRSLKTHVIHPKEKRFYKASMEYAGKKMPIKMRLKGDWKDHVNEDRHWSFYIKFETRHALRGMREFAIQHPKTRSWLYECYIVRLLRRHDILAPRCGFLSVYVNKQAWGVYLYQEAFSPQLLEAMHRRAGPILKLKEAGMWEDRTRRGHYFKQNSVSQTAWFFTERENYLLPTVGFKAKSYQEDEAQLELYAAALRKFNLYRDGDLEASEVLDLPIYAKYYAFMLLLGVGHLVDHNARDYYNPLSARFEPIYYDGYISKLEAGSTPDFLGKIPHGMKEKDRLPFLRLLLEEYKRDYNKGICAELERARSGIYRKSA